MVLVETKSGPEYRVSIERVIDVNEHSAFGIAGARTGFVVRAVAVEDEEFTYRDRSGESVTDSGYESIFPPKEKKVPCTVTLVPGEVAVCIEGPRGYRGDHTPFWRALDSVKAEAAAREPKK